MKFAADYETVEIFDLKCNLGLTVIKIYFTMVIIENINSKAKLYV